LIELVKASYTQGGTYMFEVDQHQCILIWTSRTPTCCETDVACLYTWHVLGL